MNGSGRVEIILKVTPETRYRFEVACDLQSWPKLFLTSVLVGKARL